MNECQYQAEQAKQYAEDANKALEDARQEYNEQLTKLGNLS